jgi:hypothetical protein
VEIFFPLQGIGKVGEVAREPIESKLLCGLLLTVAEPVI